MKEFRNIRIGLYPTEGQKRKLLDIVESQRQLYIAALAERIDYYQKTGKSLTKFDQINNLTECRHDIDLPEMESVSRVIQEATLTRLDRSYKAFFRRAKGGQPPGFPRFPRKEQWRSFEYRYELNRNNAPKKALYNHSGIRIPCVGDVACRNGRLPKAEDITITQAVISHNGRGRWFATVGIKFEATEREDDGRLIGIDLNTGDNMIVAWDGEAIERFGRPDTKRQVRGIRRLQRKLARQVEGSGRYKITKADLANRIGRITRQVKDAQHRATTELTRSAHTIATEKLQVKNMTRSAKGTVDKPGKNVKAKAGLNRVMREAAPARTIQMISYKAGRHIEVDPKNTSRKCNACGYTAKANRKGRRFKCLECGHVDHADHNAARNVRASAAENVASKLRGGDLVRQRTVKQPEELRILM